MGKLYQFRQLIHSLQYAFAIEPLAIGKEDSKPCLETQLLQSIANGSFPDDQTAAKVLYQSSASDARYTMLKSRLKNRLFNSLLHSNLEHRSASTLLDEQHLCDTNLLKAKRLLQLGQTQLAEKLLKQVLKTAQEYEFTAIHIACLELLSRLTFQAGLRATYQESQELLGYYRALLNVEQKAQELYEQAQWQYKADSIQYELKPEQINQVVIQLQALWEENKSYICFEYFYQVRLWQLEYEDKPEQLLKFAQAASLPASQTGINAKRFDQQGNYSIILGACLRLGNWMEGIQIAKDYLPLLNTILPTWWQFQENYFLLIVKTRQYQKALVIMQGIEQSSMKQSALESEKWALYKAYLYWLTDSSLFAPRHLFHQDCLSLRLDKHGYNIPLVILEFVYLMQTRQVSLLIDKTGLYRKYIERYLTHPKRKREWLFFKLMLLIINLNFDCTAIHKYSPKLLKQLHECTSPDSNFNDKVEIIPYGQVWHKIMSILHSQTKGYTTVTSLKYA